MKSKRFSRYVMVAAEPGELEDRGEQPWVKIKSRLKRKRHFALLSAFNAVATAGSDVDALDKALDAAMRETAAVIVEWNWTDTDGRGIKPDSDTLINELTLDEQVWLIEAVAEAVSDAKN